MRVYMHALKPGMISASGLFNVYLIIIFLLALCSPASGEQIIPVSEWNNDSLWPRLQFLMQIPNAKQ